MISNNIIEYLCQIKENIKLVESGQKDQQILDEIEEDFYQLLELIKLFLISERNSYYGYFMMNLSFKADFYCKSIAGIVLNTYPPVMESNPLLLCKFSLKEIIFIICHEIEHIILNHPAEMIRLDPSGNTDLFTKFNLAADASVNDRLIFEIENEKRTFMTLPRDCVLSETLKKMFRLKNIKPLESYYYYFRLIKDKTVQNIGNNIYSKINQNGSESESYGLIISENCDKYDDHNWKAGDDAEEITAVIRELINASAEMMDNEIRNLMPAHYLEQVRKINEPPKISWKKMLKKYIGTISAGKLKTRTRLNRRQPDRYDLSGDVSNKVLKIVVAIDTSASVSSGEIAIIFNEIFSILSKRNYCITVIECDSEIQRIYVIRKPSDLKLNIMGRGGTKFTPVIEYVNMNKFYRDSILVYFTDGYGENKIPKPLTFRNLWVITGSKNELSLKNPYGTVIGFEEGFL